MGTNQVEDYSLSVIDMPASDERVAVIARTSGRIGPKNIANEFVHVIRIVDGHILEVWNYNWGQPARRGHAGGGLARQIPARRRKRRAPAPESRPTIEAD